MYEITRDSIGGGLIDGVQEAFDSFIIDDHLVVEEGQHVYFFEVLFFHLEDYADADKGCDKPPAYRCYKDG